MEKPKANWNGAISREIDGETVVYDLRTHRAHHLNDVAARVWRAADGTVTVEQIAATHRLHPDAVRLALLEFDRRGLLVSPFAAAEQGVSLTRRALMKRAAAAAALPLIADLAVPAAAAAQTCVPPGLTFTLPGPFANEQACRDAVMIQANTRCCSGRNDPAKSGFPFGDNPPTCVGTCASFAT